jgi:hypothetical protein
MISDQLHELETVELQCTATGFLCSDSHFLWSGDSRRIHFTLYSIKTVTARKKIRICLPHPILTHSLQCHSYWAFRIESTLWSNPIYKYLQTMEHMTSWLSWKSEINNSNWDSQLVTCQNPQTCSSLWTLDTSSEKDVANFVLNQNLADLQFFSLWG